MKTAFTTLIAALALAAAGALYAHEGGIHTKKDCAKCCKQGEHCCAKCKDEKKCASCCDKK